MAEIELEEPNSLGLSDEFNTRVVGFVEASYPRFYINDRRLELGLQGAAVLGASVAGVAVWDTFWTGLSEGVSSPDDLRHDAMGRMEPAVNGIKDVLNRNPNTISVCRVESINACKELETYDVTGQEGVMRFVRDAVKTSNLPQAEEGALVTALSDQVTGPRTEESDSTIINRLEVASKDHVATIPDRVPVTTNESTGNLFVGGSALLILAAGAHRLIAFRNQRLDRKLERAHNSLKHYYGHVEGDETDTLDSDSRNQIKVAAGLIDDYSRRSRRWQTSPPPSPGGPKARQEQYRKIKEKIAQQKQQQSKAS